MSAGVEQTWAAAPKVAGAAVNLRGRQGWQRWETNDPLSSSPALLSPVPKASAHRLEAEFGYQQIWFLAWRFIVGVLKKLVYMNILGLCGPAQTQRQQNEKSLGSELVLNPKYAPSCGALRQLFNLFSPVGKDLMR